MSGKQKALLGVTLAVFLVCSASALYGYFELWPRFRMHTSQALEDEIAANVERSVALALESSADGTVRITAADLDFSSVHDDSGESGFNVTNDDATVYNGFVEILPDGVHFYLVDMKLDAMPEIVDGQFKLKDVSMDGGLTGMIFEADVLEQGVTRGVNAAFAAASLQPTGLYIRDNTIFVSFDERTSDTMA